MSKRKPRARRTIKLRVKAKARPSVTMKRKIKDSVFTHLFGEKEYLLQLYRELHPDDVGATESDLEYVTIENIVLNDIYNDLGFTVRDRLIVLVEEQAMWSPNILIRGLLYLAQTLRNYFTARKVNLHSGTRVKMPRPEFYVVYTGKRAAHPDEISLSVEFFDGEPTAIEVRAKMLYGGHGDDIVSQYVTFCEVVREQVGLHGRTREAVAEAIHICKDRNVLREYLKGRETEVIDIMDMLFSQEMAVENYAHEVRTEGETRGFVSACRDFGASIDETVARLAAKFSISDDDARATVERYWDVGIAV